MATTKDLASIIRKKLASDPALRIRVNSERRRMSVASEICRLRRKARLTQKQLAAKAGMRQSAIARLESTDYESYSLRSLQRIAEALNARVEGRFVDAPAKVKKRIAE